jgi:hypothetical protein
MTLDTIVTPDGVERKLGCLVPESPPTEATRWVEATGATVMTLDQIRTALAGRQSAYGRRSLFKGRKWIRNQGQFGSCNGWSTALALSRARVLRGIGNLENGVILSGSDAYSQMNGNQDNGSMLYDGIKVVGNGIAPESMVPWNKIYSSQISSEAKAARVNFRGLEPEAVDTEEEFATAIFLGYPGIVAVHANGAFNQLDGRGVCQGGNGPGNHSVGVDDIRVAPDGTLEYDMFNSWDTTWGTEGRCWLTWLRHLRQTVQGHRFWILRSTIDGDDVPPFHP